MDRDIAIIGMAMRCAGASNIRELTENLKNKVDSVGPISQKRIKETTIDTERILRNIGELEDVDKFDNTFFHISQAEAINMDPHQRQLLEVVYEAIENSGYSADYFDGSSSAVYLSDINPEYYKLAESFDDTMIGGNSPAFSATRIARHFNLTGNALVVDTACSSTLVAVHLACNELMMGDCDYAFVAGSSLNFMPYADKEMEYGIWSSDGKSRAFSEQADGMSCGEMVNCVILKSYKKALEDQDNIAAIIKSTAVNNNANRSSSPSAPDSVSQCNVLWQAWEKAKINPRDIRFIETHGSGTKLGDSLEVEALTAAFQKYTDDKSFCAISTIKSNVGHGYGCAGLAGLIKTAISLREKVLFSTIHVNELNKMIDFKNSAVYVETELRDWEVTEGTERIAGVTSLGASGTNCHIILQEAPPRPEETLSEGSSYIITLSSLTVSGLKEALKKYIQFFETAKDQELGNIAFTLNTGRRHFNYRMALVGSNVKDMQNQMQNILNDSLQIESISKSKRKLIFIFSDYAFTKQEVMEMCEQSSVFRSYVEACTEIANDIQGYGWCFVFQYAFYQLLRALSVDASQFLSEGIGRTVVDVMQNKISMKEGLLLSQKYEKKTFENLESRVSRLLEKYDLKQFCYISMSYKEEIANEIIAKHGENNSILVLQKENNTQMLNHFLKSIYLLTEKLDWNPLYSDKKYSRVELPGYTFEKKRCWIRETPWVEKKSLETSVANINYDFMNNIGVIEQKIVEIWTNMFEKSITSLEDNFFDIGGDSLKATQVILQLNKYTGANLDFEDIFDFPTIKTLSEYIKIQISVEQQIVLIFSHVLKSDNIDVEDSFFDMGGHSLMANQLLVRLRAQCNITLDFEDIYNNPTPRELALYIQNKQTGTSNMGTNIIPLEPTKYKEFYHASDAQKQMWVMGHIDKQNTAYNSPFRITLQGKAQFDVLRQSFAALIERHESLRTIFFQKEGQLYQKILGLSQIDVPLEQYDGISGVEMESLITQDINTLFNLEEGPLLRGKVFYFNDRTVLYFNIHHIIHDGWSSKVFLNDFIILYNSFYEYKKNPLMPLLIQYKDYSEWYKKILEHESVSILEEYWKEQLLPESAPLDLSIAKPRKEIKAFQGDKILTILSINQMKKIESVCQKEKITLYMFLLTALNILLHKYSGERDITVGSPIAGRATEELENQIGYYANTIVLRAKNIQEMTLSEAFQYVKKITLGAYSHQMYPFDKLVNLLNIPRKTNRNPLFDVMLVLQNTSMVVNNDLQLQGLEICEIDDLSGTSLFDLHFEFEENEHNARLSVTYNIELFDKQDIDGMVGDFNDLFELMCEDSLVQIEDIELQYAGQNSNHYGYTKWQMEELLAQLGSDKN
ncbi:condensation domain-containing protein [Paenibacillus polymyxa]|uniref:condensation domain-containing protein n=1 Tax=Paenibacillus polymyxa TaxID=1406 RepID=UPI002ED4485C|nr:condensation domain-containing protein [Paenibacillus polymyxa]